MHQHCQHPESCTQYLLHGSPPRHLQRDHPRPAVGRAERQAVAPPHHHQACSGEGGHREARTWAPSRQRLTQTPARSSKPTHNGRQPGGATPRSPKSRMQRCKAGLAKAGVAKASQPTNGCHIVSLVNAHLRIVGAAVRPAGRRNARAWGGAGVRDRKGSRRFAAAAQRRWRCKRGGQAAQLDSHPSQKQISNSNSTAEARLCGIELIRRSRCLGQWYRSGTSSPSSRHPACGGSTDNGGSGGWHETRAWWHPRQGKHRQQASAQCTAPRPLPCGSGLRSLRAPQAARCLH